MGGRGGCLCAPAASPRPEAALRKERRSEPRSGTRPPSPPPPGARELLHTRKALQGQDTASSAQPRHRDLCSSRDGGGHAATGAKRCRLPAQVPQGGKLPCHQPPSRRWWHGGTQTTSPPDTSSLAASACSAAWTGLVFAHPLPAAHPVPLTNAIRQKGTAVSQRGAWGSAVSPPSKCGWRVLATGTAPGSAVASPALPKHPSVPGKARRCLENSNSFPPFFFASL